MNNDIATLNNISFSYGKTNILTDVSLNIQNKKFISIVGESGIGKSTLLYILGGFIKPSKGQYLFDNKLVYKLKEIGLGRFRKKNIGFLFQDFRLLKFLTVEQNIKFPILFSGIKKSKKEIDELMKSLGIYERRKAYPHQISGGEAQRTGIARAIVMNPKLLLLDEPTGNLDNKTEKEIVNVFLSLKERGFSSVCVTHSNYIMKNSDEVYEIKKGKLIKRKKKLIPKTIKTPRGKVTTTIKKGKTIKENK